MLKLRDTTVKTEEARNTLKSHNCVDSVFCVVAVVSLFLEQSDDFSNQRRVALLDHQCQSVGHTL